MSKKLQENLEFIEDIIGFSDDVVIRKFQLGDRLAIKAALIFIDGLIDKQVINESILKPLLIEEFSADDTKELAVSDIIKFIENNTMTINELKVVDKFEEIIYGTLNGDTVLLIDGYREAFILNSKGWEMRSINEPQSETVIRGPVMVLRKPSGLIQV